MIGRVAYRSRFVKRLDDVGSLPAITTEAADLPDDVLALLDHGGTYGDPQAGDPIHYDELRIEHDQGDVVRNQHGRRNEAVASRRVSEVAGHRRLATVRQACGGRDGGRTGHRRPRLTRPG